MSKKITQVFLRVLATKQTSRIWVFLALRPAVTAHRSWTKSESCCYHLVITTGKNYQGLSPIHDNREKISLYGKDQFYLW